MEWSCWQNWRNPQISAFCFALARAASSGRDITALTAWISADIKSQSNDVCSTSLSGFRKIFSSTCTNDVMARICCHCPVPGLTRRRSKLASPESRSIPWIIINVDSKVNGRLQANRNGRKTGDRFQIGFGLNPLTSCATNQGSAVFNPWRFPNLWKRQTSGFGPFLPACQRLKPTFVPSPAGHYQPFDGDGTQPGTCPRAFSILENVPSI